MAYVQPITYLGDVESILAPFYRIVNPRNARDDSRTRVTPKRSDTFSEAVNLYYKGALTRNILIR